jgi:hypothetical protein
MKKIALLGLAWTTALLTPGLASADTQSFSTPTVSANPTAGAPVSLTETGASDPASTMTVSAQAGGGPCTAAAKPIDSVAVSGSFSHVTTFTPATPGPYTICYAFSGPNGSQSESFSIVVAPAPPPPPPATTPAAAPGPAKCVTPQLRRHTLAYAEHLLTLANCKLGRVYQPSSRTVSAAKRKNHGRAPKLVVVSQTPHTPGTVLPPGNVVAVRLGLPAPPQPKARKTS